MTSDKTFSENLSISKVWLLSDFKDSNYDKLTLLGTIYSFKWTKNGASFLIFWIYCFKAGDTLDLILPIYLNLTSLKSSFVLTLVLTFFIFPIYFKFTV
jgi:hypothetical protein